jgi:hypothetical protein
MSHQFMEYVFVGDSCNLGLFGWWRIWLCTWHNTETGFCKVGVSRGASPDMRWSPPVCGKRHVCSHLDFPQELCSTASSTTLPSRIPHIINSGCQDNGSLKVGVSRGASPGVRWSPLVFGKRHVCSHLDFPLELRSMASSTTLPSCIPCVINYGSQDDGSRKVGVSRGASPDVRWGPPVFGKRHVCLHLDFPLELRSMASFKTLPSRIPRVNNSSWQ